MSEFQIQKDFHSWCKKQPYILECWHVPNGMHSSPQACRMMKLIGLHKGVCDYWVLLDKGDLIAIEFKDDKGVLSNEQKIFINHLRLCGFNVGVCRSVFEATQFVKSCNS